MNLDSIRSRVGSVSPTAIEKLPLGIQKILKKDLPHLLRIAAIANEAYNSGTLSHKFMVKLNEEVTAHDQESYRSRIKFPTRTKSVTLSLRGRAVEVEAVLGSV